MKKRVGKSHDVNEVAFEVVRLSTGDMASVPTDGKNPAAVILGRLGGLKGGKARAEKLSARKRSEIAAKAAQTRWQIGGSCGKTKIGTKTRKVQQAASTVQGNTSV